MSEPTIVTVAVVGTGVIGRSWARVFARAGCRTHMFDPDRGQAEKAGAWLEDLVQVTVHKDLVSAVSGAGYVQESGPERIESKRAIYAEMDRVASPEAILACSTSALDMTDIASGLAAERRSLVAHPVNPPHVVPVVEVLPGKKTDPVVTRRTCEFLASVGQKPVLLNFYIPGFLLNRMQAALVREAIYLVESGVADVEAVDTVIREGLGLRWALLGPFGVADTNADGGIREYFTRYGSSYAELMNHLGSTPSFDAALIERLGRATDAMSKASRSEMLRWRDLMIRRIRALKQENPKP